MKRTGSLAVALAVALVGIVPILMSGSVSADETMVVVSRLGTVFHLAGSSDIRGQGRSKAISEALAAGYTPCPSCFASEAKTSRSLTVSAPAGATSLSTGSTLVATAPVAATLGPITAPFGLKQGTIYRVSFGEAKRDPYGDLDTIRNPGAEQGAYCVCAPSACPDTK
jgi:hypothetical protein